ncbi:hypothetical protein D3C72_616840 [compost metagenome]
MPLPVAALIKVDRLAWVICVRSLVRSSTLRVASPLVPRLPVLVKTTPKRDPGCSDWVCEAKAASSLTNWVMMPAVVPELSSTKTKSSAGEPVGPAAFGGGACFMSGLITPLVPPSDSVASVSRVASAPVTSA